MTTLHHSSSRTQPNDVKLTKLVKQRRQLASRLQKLDGQIAKLAPKDRKRKAVSPEALDRILEELANGSSNSKSLPADFSRADIYDDHD